MAGERRLNWGADATDAKWRTEHDTTNSKFILAEDLDGATVLLEYDETAGEFVSRGPVNMSGNDLSNVGAVDATSVSAGEQDITNETLIVAYPSSNQAINSDTLTKLNLDTVDKDERGEFDTSTQTFSVDKTGYYDIKMRAEFFSGADQDDTDLFLQDGNDNIVLQGFKHYAAPGTVNNNITKSQKLDSDKTYNVVVRNRSSSDDVAGDKARTYLTVRSDFR